MTYLSGKAQKRKKQIHYALALAFLIVVAFFWPSVRNKVYPVLQPSVIGFSNVLKSFGIFPEFIYTYATTRKQLVESQKVLEVRIETLENEVAQKDGLLREAALISLGTSDTPTPKPVVLYPLLQDNLKLYSTLLLSKGFKDGIEVGSVVFLRGRQAVCTIKEVYTSSSLCLLFTASNVTTEGVTSSSSITVSLIGRGGHYLGNVARDTPIIKGEKIYLRNDPSMILGEVVDVSNNNQDTSWHVFVKGAYNPLTSSVFYVQQ